MSNIFCPFCGGDQRVGEIAMMLGYRPDIAFAKLAKLTDDYATLAASHRRLVEAVRQAGYSSEWPNLDTGDPAGDEIRAALTEAEALIENN